MQTNHNVREIYSLTPLQEGFLFHFLLDKHSPAYFMQSVYELTGDVQPSLVEETLQELMNRHDILRTSFVHEGLKKAFQVVLKDRKPDMVFDDLRGLELAEQVDRIERFRAIDRARGFDLTNDVLMRLAVFKRSDNACTLIWSRHHIILDGWCMTQLVREFSQLYQGLYTQTPVTLPPVGQYRSLIKWFENQNRSEAQDFWASYLEGYDQVASLPVYQNVANQETIETKELTIPFSKEESQQIQAFCAQNQVTITTFFQAVWGIVLARYNDCRDVVFGSVCSVRPADIADVEQIVGLFINTVPTRVRFTEETTFGELIQAVQHEYLQKEKFSYYSLADIQSDAVLKQHLINHLVTTDVVTATESSVAENGGRSVIAVTDVTNSAQINYPFGVVIVPGSALTLKFNYDANRFATPLVQRIAQHTQHLLRAAIQQPQQRIDLLPMLSSEQHQALLQLGQGPVCPDPQKPLTHTLRQWSRLQPHHPAVVESSQQLTYAQLDAQVQALAHYLRRQMNLQTGQRVGVWLPRGLDAVVATLAVWTAGGVYVPINPSLPAARREAMWADAPLDLLISDTDQLWEALQANLPLLLLDLQREQWSATAPSDWQSWDEQQQESYVIFTSGSSGQPKGVPILHQALSLRAQDHAQRLNLTPTDRVLQFASQSFDASLIELAMSLVGGSTLVIAAESVKGNSALLGQLVRTEAVTVAILPPVMLQELVEESLPSLRLVITTGEKARLGVSLQYAGRGVRVLNGYGPTEACVGATFYELQSQLGASYQRRGSVPIGRAMLGTGVWVVDRQGRLQPPGVAGELVIGGGGLTRGYVSGAGPGVFGELSGVGRVYHSGDIGYWNEEGDLEYIGRRDSQVQIRGIRVEVEGVEQQLGALAGVKMVAVVAVGDPVSLVAYVVAVGGCGVAELRQQAQSRLAGYMVPTQWRLVEQLPLTTNGKVDRKALADLEAAMTKTEQPKLVLPRTPTEQVLQQIWQEVLEKPAVGITDNFFDAGGHSLKATQLVSRIYRQLNSQIDISKIFDNPTIEEIARLIDSVGNDPFARIPGLQESNYYAASPAQKRLWVMSQFENALAAYTIQGCYRITGKLDRPAFTQAFNRVVERHENLRTSFAVVDGEVVQRICTYSFNPNLVDYEHNTAYPTAVELSDTLSDQVFDLENGPLFRVKLITTNDNEQLLVFRAHHIVFDGWSLQLLFGELSAAYNAILRGTSESLSALRIQYKEYAAWQLAQLSGESMTEQRNYWVNKFAEKAPVLELPTDFTRPAVRTAEGRRSSFVIQKDLLDTIRQVCRSHEASPSMVLMAVVSSLLSRYTGQNDLVLGTPVSGRNHVELENQLGLFLNTLPIRIYVDLNESFATLLKGVRSELLDSFKHQQYPFDFLVDQLNLDRNTSRSPLFDVLISHQRLDDSKQVLFDGVQVQSVASSEVIGSKYDLEWEFHEHDDIIYVNVTHNTGLFRRESIERMIDHFLTLLNTVLIDPAVALNAVTLMNESELSLLKHFEQGPVIDFGTKLQTVVQLFECQAEVTPDRIAVSCLEHAFTYAELNRKANQLACYLTNECGIRRNDIVAYRAERSEWSLVAMLGIMKAGGAYLPLSPELPAERTTYLLHDTGAKAVVLWNEEVTSGTHTPSICVNDPLLATYSVANPQQRADPQDRAYVIYTSGSTGLPKGVLLHHAGLLNHLQSRVRAFDLTQSSRVVQSASQSFDISMWQSLAALLVGGQTLVFPTELVQQPNRFVQALEDDGATVLQVVPTYLNELVMEWETGASTQSLPQLQYIATIGEALKASLVERWYRRFPKITFTNTYGPTEASDTVAQHVVNLDDISRASIAIGRPIENLRIHILDTNGNRCPIGVKGDLYVAGIGVGIGYINNLDKTHQSFKTDPFVADSRMYSTGDVARWQADGTLEYFGRSDHQVKIRGYRIELGEIEQNLSRLPMVRESAVIVRYTQYKEPYLCAYIVSKSGADTSAGAVRRQLGEWIPVHMVPDHFLFLDDMPLTLSGKIDRNRLSQLDPIEVKVTEEFIQPASLTEENLLRLFEELLETPRISVTDNFFRLGGQSLKAIRLRSRIESTEGVTLTLKDIFNQPTVAQLADLVDSVRWLNETELSVQQNEIVI